MRSFKLADLAAAELNLITHALGQQPHDQVFGLLQKIHSQAQHQIAAAQARAAAKAKPAGPAEPVSAPPMAKPGDDKH